MPAARRTGKDSAGNDAREALGDAELDEEPHAMDEPVAAAPGASLTKRTAAGLRWSAMTQVGTQSILFLSSIVLARLLVPDDFGLAAMVAVFTSFALLFAEMGFGAAIVQKQEVAQRHLSSVFWLNVGVGVMLTLLFLALAPAIAAFFGDGRLVPLVRFAALNFVLASINIVQRMLLSKDLDFRSMSIIEVATIGLAIVVSVALAVAGAGPWSIVAQGVVASASRAVWLWVRSPWRPGLEFDVAALRELAGFSGFYFLDRILSYWSYNLDNALIGRYRTPEELGVYARAYAVLLLPLINLSKVVSRVLFPAFARAQKDKAYLREQNERMTRVVAFVVFPVNVGLLVAAESFTIGLYGETWRGMVPILQILALAGLVAAIRNQYGTLFLSLGRARLAFTLNLVFKAVTFTAIVVGLQWGVEGVAWGLVVATAINTLPQLHLAGRLIDLSLMRILRNLLPVAAVTAVMGVAVWLATPTLWALAAPASAVAEESGPALVVLLAQAGLGALLYVGSSHLLGVQAYRDLLALVGRKGQGGRPSGAG